MMTSSLACFQFFSQSLLGQGLSISSRNRKKVRPKNALFFEGLTFVNAHVPEYAAQKNANDADSAARGAIGDLAA
ncbi:MAG: hypothetical protein V5A14_00155 [Desulfohalobiaceae bacterium]